MRTVEVRRFHAVAGKREELPPVTGKFHQWGIAFEEFETGPGNYTVAIVELPDGTITTHIPDFVRFLD
ncbi:hypothetical protein [Pantoea sp. A4]|uniref:hypothetical protein n=1 Tax=Pantoea sp. A4 TaxID=1225184 RepID=UPI00035E04EB|nr:hypothetical protein [Pantoea sp. A4]